ncbi:adenylate/guanylate cyclase domain-containing protein [Beggiatoa leptomitoformis]|uniref:PAS domain S-box protein n=1 Tax=Beggiatoa leptomitoformis TaxID=288004 RepID=A0A2N9YFV7_9GAMM|nr:adenylate/guanylate cyclase domain-containing protein [Beggiatoa leptomitoformis]AUI69259.1 PAS domain S-box protein [Beggiatoa leptomitoformis]QGX03737.1 PAS domain S-box protein [Beggiatoa leptomitoformis]
MILALVRNTVFTVGILFLLAFFWFNIQAINLTEHERFINDARLLKAGYASLNQDVLKVRYGLVNHYDELNKSLNILLTLLENLKQFPHFLTATETMQLAHHLEEQQTSVKQKKQLLESFKSLDSSYKSSFTYFPALINELTLKLSQRKNSLLVTASLEQLLRDVLRYDNSPNEALKHTVESTMGELEGLLLDSHTNDTTQGTADDVNRLHQQVQLILENKPALDAQLQELVTLPADYYTEPLFMAYSDYYQQARERVTTYQYYFTGLLLTSLLIVISFTSFKFRTYQRGAQQAHHQFQQLFEHSQEGFFQRTGDGRYLLVNPALARIFGFDSPTALIHAFSKGYQRYVAPEQLSDIIHLLKKQNSAEKIESQIYRKDGSTAWIRENIHAVRDTNGDLLYYQGTVENISECKQLEDTLHQEKQLTDRLLTTVLPIPIANQVKAGKQAVAQYVEESTILFADLVGFTNLTNRLPPQEFVDLLNQIFNTFDKLAEAYRLEKIKTIGDAYMVAGGVLTTRRDHAQAIADIALDMRDAVRQFRAVIGENFDVRIGIHTGAVVSGVIGTKRFNYDIWGETVNIASQMESTGLAGCIQVSETTYQLLRQEYLFTSRGILDLKGKTKTQGYLLKNKKWQVVQNRQSA